MPRFLAVRLQVFVTLGSYFTSAFICPIYRIGEPLHSCIACPASATLASQCCDVFPLSFIHQQTENHHYPSQCNALQPKHVLTHQSRGRFLHQLLLGGNYKAFNDPSSPAFNVFAILIVGIAYTFPGYLAFNNESPISTITALTCLWMYVTGANAVQP